MFLLIFFFFKIDGENNAKKILLLNPYISTLRVFDVLTKFLLSEDFCVLRFDYRCTGKTVSKYERLTSTILSQDALALIDHLGWKNLHLFG